MVGPNVQAISTHSNPEQASCRQGVDESAWNHNFRNHMKALAELRHIGIARKSMSELKEEP